MAGILKDILLVCASMMIFRDPVTGQQFFGYSIALGGLLYYKLGGEKLRSLATDVRLGVGEYRRANPAKAKVIVFGAFATIFVLALYSLSSASPMEYVKAHSGVASSGFKFKSH